MRKLLAVGAVAAGLSFVACGGGSSTTPVTTPTSGPTLGPPVVVAPMKLVLDDSGKVGLEVHADGTIVTGDGVLVASFDGRKLVSAHSGKGVRIEDDGTIHPLEGAPPKEDVTLKFDEVGDIVTSDGSKIGIGADGHVVVVWAGKPPKTVPAHVEGMTPATHRMAALLAFVALMAHRHEASTEPSAVEVSPAVPPPPPPPPPTPTP